MNSINKNSIETVRSSGKKILEEEPVRSLEYELSASLVMQQYVKKGRPDFEQLLSIPLADRIPGLTKEHGKQKAQQLIRLVLDQFCLAFKTPLRFRLTETVMDVCACDIHLAAEEDQLSMEELIIFFELTIKGKYGALPALLTHFGIVEKLEAYRKERFEAYLELRDRTSADKGYGGQNLGHLFQLDSLPKPEEESGARVISMKGYHKAEHGERKDG
jgi:hypothetical protein